MTNLSKLAAIAALIAPALATGAFAQGADANGDGLLTIDEVQAVYPDVTAEAFAAMDVDGDGALNAEEMEAAQASGDLPSDS